MTLLLSPHFMLGGTGYADWLKARPRVVKLCGAFPRDAVPDGTLVIGRATTSEDTVNPEMGSPEKVALDYFFLNDEKNNRFGPRITALKNPWIKYWEAQNEPAWNEGKTAEQYRADMRWYARYHAEFSKLCWEHGLRAIIGSWSVGTPYLPAAPNSKQFTPDDAARIWDDYTVALFAIRRYGAVFSRHSYGALNEWLGLRHRADYRALKRLGYGDITVVITECGEENIGLEKPWKLNPKYNGLRSYFDNYLVPLEMELRKDADYLLGATVFTLGTGGSDKWEPYDVASNEIGVWMQQLANTAMPAPVPPPPPAPEKPLFTFNGAGHVYRFYKSPSLAAPVEPRAAQHDIDVFELRPYGGPAGVWARVTRLNSSVTLWMRMGV